jgi:acetyl-CoA carboxylase carboxyltransferase component
MYPIHPIITALVDKNSFFEIGSYWGKNIVVGLARLDGRPVGVFANNFMVNAGALDSQGCQKLSKHLKLCDVIGLPLVQLVDIPGFAIGTVTERSGVMKWAMELCKTYFTTTIPISTTIIRRCYGIGGVILVDNREPKLPSCMVRCRRCYRFIICHANKYHRPSANWGSIPLDGGIEGNYSLA